MSIKFKDLTKKDLEYLSYVYYSEMSHKEKMEILTKRFNVSERSIRRWWKEELNLSEKFSLLPHQLVKAQNRSVSDDVDIIFVTAAQNKTAVNQQMLNNMKAYAKFLRIHKNKKVEIIISPSRYRNPTSPIEADKKSAEDWWVDELNDYLYYGKLHFGDVLVSSDSRVRPTAANPLIGYEVLAKDNHIVIPHSKIHFKTIPRLRNKPLRTLSTTGFITVKNYSESKVGDVSHAHHSYGFIVIERKKDKCYIPRNVKVNSDGGFVDIIYSVSDGAVSVIDSSLGFVYGDIHSRVVDKDILDRTLNLVKQLKPQKQILHDVLDASSINPHERKDMYIQRQKIIKGQHLLEKEVEESLDLIDYIHTSSEVQETYVVLSNHELFLDRHINDENWKKDLHNSPAYLKYAYIQQTIDLEPYGSVYGYLLEERFGNKGIKYLTYDSGLDIGGYECGLHGDITINGARSNNTSFARLNMKMIMGHQHSPNLQNGVTTVGVTAKLNQYYNRKSLSSWCHAHCVIHNNEKNQLLVYDDDREISSLL